MGGELAGFWPSVEADRPLKPGYTRSRWKGGRAAEGDGLLNRLTCLGALREFESPPFRFTKNAVSPLISGDSAFLGWMVSPPESAQLSIRSVETRPANRPAKGASNGQGAGGTREPTWSNDKLAQVPNVAGAAAESPSSTFGRRWVAAWV